MTFVEPTGQIWVGDVGNTGMTVHEEVNLIVKGGNYQWNFKEGPMDVVSPYVHKPSPMIGIEKPPIYAYPHSGGRSCVIGGYVYRGDKHAKDLRGRYIFGDLLVGRIYAMDYRAGKKPVVEELCKLPPKANLLTVFGVDSDNELYICVFRGLIYKLARAGSRAAPILTKRSIPSKLSETGAFADIRTLTPAAGIIPYDVNAPSFSDNAWKQRWIAPAKDKQIGFEPKSAFKYPNGTVFIKHFELAMDPKKPERRRRLETRLLVRDKEGGVYGVVYKWRDDNSDADLLKASLSEKQPNGQVWYYPSSSDCIVCHNRLAGSVLGPSARQLNRSCSDAPTSLEGNQLLAWSRAGLFDRELSQQDVDGCDKLADIHDTSRSLEDRVRSYLDTNCSYCHRPYGARAIFDARYETPLEEQLLLHGYVHSDLGIKDARVVVPKDPERSILFVRMKSCGKEKMPPLSRNIEDDKALEVVHEWIMSLDDGRPLVPQRFLWLGVAVMGIVALTGFMRSIRWSKPPIKSVKELQTSKSQA